MIAGVKRCRSMKSNAFKSEQSFAKKLVIICCHDCLR